MTDSPTEMTTDSSRGKRGTTTINSLLRPRFDGARRCCGGMVLAVLVAVPLLVFANTLPGEFVFDDLLTVVKDPAVNGTENPFQSFTRPYGPKPEKSQGYRPLMTLSLAIDYWIGSGKPWVFHASNVILHIFATLAVFAILRSLSCPTRIASIATIFFAAHPIHVEPIAFVTGRSELLVGAFGLWMIALHSARGEQLRSAVLAALLWLIALMSKEHALLIAPLIFLIDLAQKKTTARAKSYLIYGIALAAYFAIRIAALGSLQGATSTVIPFQDNPIAAAPTASRILTALWVLARYIGLIVAPIRLSADYSYAEIVALGPGDPAGLLGLGLIAFLVVVAIVLLKRSNIAGVGISFFLIAFGLTANLILPIGTIMAERLAYLPSVGASLVVAALIAAIPGTPKWRGGTAVAIVVLFGAFTYRSALRNSDWWSELRLFQSTANTSQHSFKAHYNYALALIKAGRDEESFAELSTAIKLYPEGSREALLHRGNFHVKSKRLRKAMEDFARSAELGGDERGYLSAGKTALVLGELDKAVEWLTKAVEQTSTVSIGNVQERWEEAHYRLAIAHKRRGEDDRAKEVLMTLFRQAPNHIQGKRLLSSLDSAGY